MSSILNFHETIRNGLEMRDLGNLLEVLGSNFMAADVTKIYIYKIKFELSFEPDHVA